MNTLPPAKDKALVPLCVDLDGTVLRTDLVWESLVRLLKQNPFYLFLVLIWWLRGRACLKANVAARVNLDVGSLPFNLELLDWLTVQRRAGRQLVLVTASDARLAHQVAEHLGFFDEVLASDGKINLRGKAKGARLAERYGVGGFDYAGNSSVDLPVWAQARQAIVVGATDGLATRAKRLTEVSNIFGPKPRLISPLMRALGPQHWIKNLLVFVPLITALKFGEGGMLLSAFLAFVAFNLCDSAVYVLSELSDLEADRHHSTKKLSPFAAGDYPVSTGVLTVPLLLLSAAILSWQLPLRFLAVLGLYLILATGYHLRLKAIPRLDVISLAGLYTLCLVGGYEAIRAEYKVLVLGFSIVVFLALAFTRRTRKGNRGPKA